MGIYTICTIFFVDDVIDLLQMLFHIDCLHGCGKPRWPIECHCVVREFCKKYLLQFICVI